MATVHVLGTGLIGTSIGLALSQSGWTVFLSDLNPDHVEVAVTRGAGQRWTGSRAPHLADDTSRAGDGSAAMPEPPRSDTGSAANAEVTSRRTRPSQAGRGEGADLVVAAGPPSAVAGQLQEAQRLGLGRTYTHVASVQSQVQRQVEELGCDLSSIVGSHPLAGRETSGPRGASADLFAGRTWALCPSALSSPTALADVRSLVIACGATSLVATAEDHDRSVALLSHLPQVVSSALAAQLDPVAGEEPAGQTRSGILSELSGPGLVGTTRLAAGSTALWTDILLANAVHVAPVVRALARDLLTVASALELSDGRDETAARGSAHPDAAPFGDAGVTSTTRDAPDASRAAVVSLLQRGVRGRATVAVKRGVGDDGFARVAVHVDDRPGRLAALLTDAGQAGTNVEDVRVDHVPGRPTGAIELLVARESAAGLRRALTTAGWRLVSPDGSLGTIST